MLIDNITFFNLYNLIYFCTACLVLVSALSSEIKKDVLFQNSLAQYLVAFPLISLVFLVGFREYNVGVDTQSYYKNLWEDNIKVDFSGEFLLDLMALIFRYFDLSFTLFLFLISFLFYIFLYKALKKYTEIYNSNLLITFFSCISFFFFLSMSINVIRQGVSLSILLFACSLWLGDGNNRRILMLLLLSLAFHSTSIIPFLIFLFCIFWGKFKVLPYFILFYFISICLAYINIGFQNFSSIFLDFLENNSRSNYFSGEDYGYQIGFKPQFVVFNTLFLLIGLYVRNGILNIHLKNKYDILMSYYIISSIFLFMAFQLPYSDRWGLFSWFVIPFLISPLFYSPFIKRNIRIQYIVMLVLIYLGFNFYAS